MYEPRHHYESPPGYSPPYNGFHSPRGGPYEACPPGPPDSFYLEERPQHFYRWLSPPGLVKTLEGVTVLMCFLIFVCVASTLVWDVQGGGYGGHGGGEGVGTGGGGYYGGSYGYGGSYMTPSSAKSAMISMAAVNFLASLGVLVGSFSRSRAARGRRFYLTVFVADVVLAVLQGIIDIVFVIGVNPAAQSSQSALYNPMLMMCQNLQPGRPGLSGAVGAGFPGGLPMYSQYLQHYCYMDPEEAVALVLGLFVVLALCLAAYYAYKTRSKIWRHGKANIYWDPPLERAPGGPDVQDWVNRVDMGRSTQQAPTVIQSERAVPGNSMVSHGNGTVSIHSEGVYHGNTYQDNTNERGYHDCAGGRGWSETQHQNTRGSSSPPEPGVKRASQHTEREGGVKQEHKPLPPPDVLGVHNETGYTTGGDTGNELDQDQSHYLFSLYPEIMSDVQRRQYKRDFAADLRRYKSLCAELDDVSDQLHELGRELDALEEDSLRYQGVVDEYNRLKDLKRTPDYQAKKKLTGELRHKLFHIKRLVKNFDNGLC
ncbi:occludin [Aplochiton taeniatus]